jgi:hypothetical protein
MTSKIRAIRKLIRKKIGMRYAMDVIPLDASLVKGSHGLNPSADDGPLVIGPGDPPEKMTQFKSYLARLLTGA